MTTMALERKTIGSSNLIKYGLTDTRVKKAHGFIQDIQTTGEYFRQPFIKLNSRDAFKLYQFNEWLFSTVNRTVDDCVKVKPNVTVMEPDMEITESRRRRITRVKNFLRRPNENKINFTELRKKFLTDLQVFGHGAYEKVFNPDTGTLMELHDLQAANMEVRSDINGNLLETDTYKLEIGNFRRSKNSRVVFFDKDEVLFASRYPMSGSHYGVKPIDSIANAVASDMLRAAYNSNFFINGAEASGILSVDGMSKVEMRKFRQYWDSKFKGARNAHKIAAVNVPVNFVRMALTNQDMQFSEYGLELRQKIFAVYGMQPIILGIQEGGGAIKNKEEAVKCYKEAALKPLLQIEADSYTEEIVFQGFGYSDIRITFDAIDDLDLQTQSAIDEKDLMMGVKVINEVRGARGLPDVLWGDTPIQMFPGGAQIDPDTGKLIPPSEQGNGQNNNNSNNSKSFYCGKELENYFISVKNYVRLLHSKGYVINKDNFQENFKHFSLDFQDSHFKDFRAKTIANEYLSLVGTIFNSEITGDLENIIKKIDSFIKEIKQSKMFKDVEHVENVN